MEAVLNFQRPVRQFFELLLCCVSGNWASFSWQEQVAKSHLADKQINIFCSVSLFTLMVFIKKKTLLAKQKLFPLSPSNQLIKTVQNIWTLYLPGNLC